MRRRLESGHFLTLSFLHRTVPEIHVDEGAEDNISKFTLETSGQVSKYILMLLQAVSGTEHCKNSRGR